MLSLILLSTLDLSLKGSTSLKIRKVFAQNLLNFQSGTLRITFMEEKNLKIHISRSLGHSIRSSRCSAVAAGSKVVNIYVFRTISCLRLIYYKIKRRNRGMGLHMFKSCNA